MARRVFWLGNANSAGDAQAITKLTEIFGDLEDYSTRFMEKSLQANFEINNSDLDQVVIPDVSWDTIAITGALAYWAEVLANTLSLPSHVIIPYNPPADLTIPTDVREYDDTLRQALSTSIVSDLNSGGYGIKNDNEDYIFEAARDKSNKELDDAKKLIFFRHGARGFSRPAGAMQGDIFAGIEKYNASINEVSNKLTVESNDKYAKAKGETYINAVDLAKVAFDKFSLLLRLAAQAYRANMLAFYSETKAGYDLAKSEYDSYLSTVLAYAGEMDAAAKSYQALATTQEFGFRQYNSQVMAAIEEAKATLDAIIEELKLYTAYGDIMVKANAGMAAASLSGMDINARVSRSDSHESSQSTSTNRTESAGFSAQNQKSVTVSTTTEADEGGNDFPNASLP